MTISRRVLKEFGTVYRC